MRQKNIRVGVIGTSWWVDLMYVPSLRSHPLAEVVAVCGRNSGRADEVAANFGAKRVFQDYRQLIGDGGCDAVVIATPDDLHFEMTMEAIEAGLHVLCEKPLAGNTADARAMYERARSAGVKHMVLFTWRSQPHWRYVKTLVDSGYIGRCRHCEFRFLSSFALDPGYKWRFDGRRANGVTGDLGSHMIDFAQWFLGDVTAVHADLRNFVDQSSTANPSPLPANDAGFLSLEFANQARAEIAASAVTLLGDEGVRVTAALYGDEGSIEVRHSYFGIDAGAVIRGVRKGEPAFSRLPVPNEYLAGGVDPTRLFDPYVKQSEGPRLFIDAIAADLTIETDFALGVRVQEVVDAALASVAERRWIRLGD
jgi:predicted dehydrogenase